MYKENLRSTTVLHFLLTKNNHKQRLVFFLSSHQEFQLNLVLKNNFPPKIKDINGKDFYFKSLKNLLVLSLA